MEVIQILIILYQMPVLQILVFVQAQQEAGSLIQMDVMIVFLRGLLQIIGYLD